MIDIYHNMLWPKYKGAVFSEAFSHARQLGRSVRFSHVVPTDGGRTSMSNVDASYHKYPHRVLFDLPYEAIPRWKLCLRLVQEVWRSPADIVVMPGYHLIEYWAMLLACMVRGKRRAVFCDATAMDQPSNPIKHRLKVFFFRHCDGVFVYGQRGYAYAVSLGAEPSRVFDRCQAAALPHGYRPEHAEKRRLELAPSPSSPRFLFVGRISEKKGVKDLLRAFALVLREHPLATLVLAGPCDDRPSLDRLAGELGVTAATEFLGPMAIDKLAAEYGRATCLVLPSHSEAWGLVVNEALSYGCPAVVSDHCGCIPELVLEGETGLTFPVRDIQALAGTLGRAVRIFSDVEATARRCLEVIGEYTPAVAGRTIVDGCIAILEEARR